MIRRYIIWRNNHAYDKRLRCLVDPGKRQGRGVRARALLSSVVLGLALQIRWGW
jgi:hypothetical protein